MRIDIFAPMISPGIRLVWFWPLLLLCLLACGGSPETLATFEGGSVTVSQLTAHMDGLRLCRRGAFSFPGGQPL